MFLLYSSGGPGQSSAPSGDKAFEDWLSDDVNSYQRLEPYTLHLLTCLCFEIFSLFFYLNKIL